MAERYYGTMGERGWTNRVESRDAGISMRFIRAWKADEDQIVTPHDCDVLRREVEAFRIFRDRRALPPDGPDIGPDVPGGGAV